MGPDEAWQQNGGKAMQTYPVILFYIIVLMPKPSDDGEQTSTINYVIPGDSPCGN